MRIPSVAETLGQDSSQRTTSPRTTAQPRVLSRLRTLTPAPAALLLAAFLGPPAPNRAPSGPMAQDSVSAPSTPARDWAADCANNEILVIQHPGSYLRYRLHEINEKGDEVRDQIETPDGSVARLIQHDGKPLTPDEDSAERERLNSLIDSPATFARHIRNDQANKKLGIDLLKLIPDAMLWSYAAGQPQPSETPSVQSADAAPLIVLDFKPNPKWPPPNIPAETLTGLEGRVWIAPQTRRMVRLEANLFHAVNIGWGVVAHIYPGGTVTLHQTSVQTNAGDRRFIVDHIVEQLTLRALLVKTVKQRLVFDAAEFQPILPMTYQQAIKILLVTPLPTH